MQPNYSALKINACKKAVLLHSVSNCNWMSFLYDREKTATSPLWIFHKQNWICSFAYLSNNSTPSVILLNFDVTSGVKTIRTLSEGRPPKAYFFWPCASHLLLSLVACNVWGRKKMKGVKLASIIQKHQSMVWKFLLWYKCFMFYGTGSQVLLIIRYAIHICSFRSLRSIFLILIVCM